MGLAAADSYWFFLRVVLEYRFLDPWDHGEEIVWFLEQNLGKPMLFLLPRGSCKSGAITVPFPAWKLAKDPFARIIIANAREEKAAAFARGASKIISDSENYRRFFPHIKPTDKWGVSGYNIESPTVDSTGGALDHKDPSISSYGVGGNITGAHVTDLIEDDLINDEMARHSEQVLRAERFFSEALNCLDPGGQLLVCGTRWVWSDFYGKIENGELQGPTGRFAVMKRGAERYGVDNDGRTVKEIFNQHRTYIDFNGRQKQVGYTSEYLDAQKKNLGSLYWGLFQNDPLAGENAEFDLTQVREYQRFPTDLGPVTRVGIEKEGGGSVFISAFIDLMRNENRWFHIDQLSVEGVEKLERIRGVLGPVIDSGNLYIREDLWNREDNLGGEIRNFREFDAMDALSHCIKKAPKWNVKKGPQPYIAVDLAFTVKRQSNSTAIVAGCWLEDAFYVLDCNKFKAQKVEIIARQIFRMFDKYSNKRAYPIAKRPAVSATVSPGNERRKNSAYQNIWGDGTYSMNVDEREEHENR